MSPEAFAVAAAQVETELRKLIVGQDEVVRDTVIALLAGGHVLLEGVPGLGKTSLVRALGDVLELSFSRIQFTPDLMPADITGTTLIQEDEGGRRFHFQPGRCSPTSSWRTRSTGPLPRCKAPCSKPCRSDTVTVGGATRPLPNPFFVLATQNPIELEGTYPLPEAQLDRFLFKLSVPYPSDAELAEIARRTTGTAQPGLAPVVDAGQVLAMSALVRTVPLAEHVLDYAVRLVSATQPDRSPLPDVASRVRFGASPRAVQALALTGKARALLAGRFNVAFDDIRASARPVLRHRLAAELRGRGRRGDERPV